MTRSSSIGPNVVSENSSEGTDLVSAGLSYSLATHFENLTLTATAATTSSTAPFTAIAGFAEIHPECLTEAEKPADAFEPCLRRARRVFLDE